MKKVFAVALLLSLCISLAPKAFAVEAVGIMDPGISISIDGVLSQPTNAAGNPVYPIVYAGTTYVPVRGLSYLFGKSADWDVESRTVVISDKNVSAPALIPDSKPSAMTLPQVSPDAGISISYNGKIKILTNANGETVYPMIYKGTTYIPIRGAANLFSRTVDWNSKTRTVLISSSAASILADAEARRSSVINCETEIKKSGTAVPGETYTGTAYYVSNFGSDDNNGLTPNTAWATVSKVNRAELKAGDAVFFERGDVWRGDYLYCKNAVTYSAYGKGEKPRFYGSPEDGAGLNKWQLYYEGKNGEKVWKFYKNITDTGGIVFNDGDSYAERIYGWWAKNGYVLYEHPDQSMEPDTCLDKNLTFCSMIDYSGYDYPICRYDLNLSGPLYLRCDAGNPGTLFRSIEFETKDTNGSGWYGILNVVDNCVIDNLCVLYYGDAGIRANPDAKDIIVQNCEVGWGGNCIHEYSQPTPTVELMISGDGIYGECTGAVIKSNYCHEIDGGAITFESYPELAVTGRGNYNCCGNLVERCGQGIWLHDDMNKIKLDKVSIDDNYILYTGYGYCHGCWCDLVSINFDTSILDVNSISITNNVLFLSKQYLFEFWSYENSPLSVNRNIYVQNAGGDFAVWPRLNWSGWKMNDKDLQSKAENLMGDKLAVILTYN